VLAGFGDPFAIIVAGLLVIGEMLTRMGIAFTIGRRMAEASGDGELRRWWRSRAATPSGISCVSALPSW
jgi:hypothetical protein